ncbi:UPF0715 family protein [Metabacillus sp. DBTR6]|uniref:UPF0715 family protein n=2 Tax=Metabacillus rhizolycopersici TaxID=2875709 RepID=A0ABS7UVB2_9BACI|nr:UPF0715 family protein [Metabacillus rhizolycopersici]
MNTPFQNHLLIGARPVFLVDLSYFSFFGIAIYSLISFFIYLVIGLPIQFKLNQKPKKFNIIYLIIYGFWSAIVTAIFTKFYGYENPFASSTFYIMTTSSTVIFWIFDSIFLQSKTS